MTPITREQAQKTAEKHGLLMMQSGYAGSPVVMVSSELSKFANMFTDFRQQVIADLAREAGEMPLTFNVAGNGSFNGFNACTENDVQKAIASLQAKLEQSEARRLELEKAIPNLRPVIEWLEGCCDPIVAAKELSIYNKKIDAALNKEPGHEA